MKKLFSILFAAMIVLTGMHLSVATHLCAGEIAAVKWSLSDEKASCGMEMVQQTNCSEKSYSSENCCKDEISFYTVDTNYNPSTIQINKPVNQLLQVFYIPTDFGILFGTTSQSSNTNIQPPGIYFASAVSLPDICVFLI
jgi:hypothetical protein